MVFKYNFEHENNISHKQCLVEIRDTLTKTDSKLVARAFLHSLKTRQLEYRSALGSYYYAISIPDHDVYRGYSNSKNIFHCYLCGWYNTIDVDAFEFERQKYGGVRHELIDYVLYDLKEFIKLPQIKFNKDDIKILLQILNCVKELQPTDKVGKLRDVILKKKLIPANKDELSVLLGILGICGILSSETHKCYQDEFVDEYKRAPVESKNDFSYPVNRWHAKDGVNQERLKLIFGEYL